MFGKIAASCIALLVTVGCAYPQSDRMQDPAAPDTIPMYTVADCMPGEDFRRYLIQNFSHEPLLLGYGFIVVVQEDGTETVAEGAMFLTANLETGTWSVSITFEDDMSCNVISGFELQPMTYGPPGIDL